MGDWIIPLIDPARVEPNPFFCRSSIEATLDEAFVKSATRNLKQPIIVRPKAGVSGEYQLAFGHRRWAAFRRKNLKIPARILALSDEEMVDYAWDDTFHFAAHEPEEEAQLILTRLDFKLRHKPGYESYGCNPLSVLRAMDSQRHPRIVPPRGGKNKTSLGRPQQYPLPVPRSVVKVVKDVFSELPEKRGMNWVTFLRHRVPLLEMPNDIRKALDEREIVGSARAKEAIAKVQDELARKMMIDWVCAKNRVAVRLLDKRTRILNKCTEGLNMIHNSKERQRIIELVINKCPSWKDTQLEVDRAVREQLELGRSNTGLQSKDNLLDFAYVGRDSKDMHEVTSESVRLIITSPPYFNKLEFEDYLSRCTTSDEFFLKVDPIIAECYRVLAPGGKLCINWGEPIGEDDGVEYEEQILVHRWVDVCNKNGLRLMARFIWWKDPPSYAIAKDRVKFSDAVRGDGKAHLNWEWILVFRKPGPKSKTNGSLSHDEFVELSNAVWRIPAARDGPRGLAVFPDQLVERLIKYYTSPRDIVLDPFLGTGTTVKVATRLGRHGVGYEIAKWLSPVIERKLSSMKAYSKR